MVILGSSVMRSSWRQWIRHRPNRLGEYSALQRGAVYALHRPDVNNVPQASATSRQAADVVLTAERHLMARQDRAAPETTVPGERRHRELARIALPVSVYTQWYWKIDLHNLPLLSLRMGPLAGRSVTSRRRVRLRSARSYRSPPRRSGLTGGAPDAAGGGGD